MRQRIRKIRLLFSFLLFPITIWYFSPYLIIQAATEHIMNGSFIGFCLMFVLSMFFGRVWCGYLCPAGGLQECTMRVNDNPAKLGKRDRIKYVIYYGVIMLLVLPELILCSMGLDVKKMVSDGTIANCTECIQCGACVDECPKKVLSYKWRWR